MDSLLSSGDISGHFLHIFGFTLLACLTVSVPYNMENLLGIFRAVRNDWNAGTNLKRCLLVLACAIPILAIVLQTPPFSLSYSQIYNARLFT